MGDYTLYGLHFTLKKETPKEVLDVVTRRFTYGPRLPLDPVSIADFSPLTSAYHRAQNFLDTQFMYSAYDGEYEGLRFNTIFQVKYDKGIKEFVDFISPWAIVTDWNKGCIGWKLSEYCTNPTYLFVKSQEEDPKDKDVQELVIKCKELLELIHKSNES